MNKFRVSKKDVKLLIIIVALIGLYLTYQFVYTKNLNQAELLNADITNLETRVSELQVKVDQGDKIREDNQVMQKKFDEIVHSYGNGTSEEKSIIMVKNLEDVADMTISTASFSDPVYIFNGSNTTEGQADMTAVDKAGAELDAATGEKVDSTTTQTVVDTQQLAVLEGMSGYKTAIAITFNVSYEGFKKCVDYINNYPEKCNVGDVSLSYDTETGMLSGTMSINMYHLIGDKIEYQAPVANSTNIGRANIFGTIELPTATPSANGQ